MPIIVWSSIRVSMAASPNRVASIRSLALGVSPRCRCPRMETLHHIQDIPFYPVGIVHGTSIFILGTFGHNDDTAVFCFSESTSDKCLQLVHIRFGLRNNGSFSPEAIALFWARKPASRPITSTKKCGRVRLRCLLFYLHIQQLYLM